MGHEKVAEVPEHLMDLLLPSAGVWIRDLHLSRQFVKYELEELLLARYVRVERRWAGPQLLGDPTHRQLFDARRCKNCGGGFDDCLCREGALASNLLFATKRGTFGVRIGAGRRWS